MPSPAAPTSSSSTVQAGDVVLYHLPHEVGPVVPALNVGYDRGAMNLLDRIEVNPKVMGGKPVIRGTRITVEHILEELEAGQDPIELLEHGHPELQHEDLLACIEFGRGDRRAVPG